MCRDRNHLNRAYQSLWSLTTTVSSQQHLGEFEFLEIVVARFGSIVRKENQFGVGSSILSEEIEGGIGEGEKKEI
jgi:hypothetical protein